MATLTPPKYIEALRDREKSVLLEERLKHFILWCYSQNVQLVSVTDNGGYQFVLSEVNALIEEYVNG